MGRNFLSILFRALPLGLAAALAISACGDGTTDSSVGSTETIEPPDGDGLALRLTGSVTDGLLCPGGQRPCFTLDRDVEPDADGRARLVGRLVDGTFIVESEQEVPSQDGPRSYPDRCEGKVTEGANQDDVFEALDGLRRSLNDRYAIQWLSDGRVVHFGVVGDAADVEQAVAELGLTDEVCVVGGFERSEAELLEITMELGRMMEGWPADRREQMGWGPEPFDGVVSLSLFQADAEMLDEIAMVGDGAVRVSASIEVLNGTLADLEQALADAPGATPTPKVVMTCGDVTFPGIPADPDAFPPLDAEAEAAFDSMMEGPAGSEAGLMFDGFTWSIASRTETELVLFGRGEAGLNDDPSGNPPYADVTFRRSGEEWIASSFGGCRLQVAAEGLGPATMILDPDREPDPASTELPVLINERNCASGQAPVDREIVPVVTETETTVEITVFVAPVKGGAECPSNPFHPIVITLDEPLGGRTVIDATTQPGQIREWPPSQADLNG